MFAYVVDQFGDYLPGNHRTFFLSCRIYPDGDFRDLDSIVIIRTDHKFAVFRNVVYRVCHFDPYEDLESHETFLLKVWITDPFRDMEDYEQIPPTQSTNWDLTLW